MTFSPEKADIHSISAFPLCVCVFIINYDRITFADPLKREEEKIVAYLARIEELYIYQ